MLKDWNFWCSVITALTATLAKLITGGANYVLDAKAPDRKDLFLKEAMLRRNRTIDWQKKETARATMRKMVKRLLKKYDYPPEDYDFAITTVISQCELWTDNSSGM